MGILAFANLGILARLVMNAIMVFTKTRQKNADINHEFGEGVICSGKLTKSIYLKIMINTINFY